MRNEYRIFLIERSERQYRVVDLGIDGKGKCTIRGILSKVTSGDMLTKQALTKFIIYKKFVVLKLLLKLLTAGIEALVVPRNNFLYVWVKKAYCL
jgi:hypothetical protein